jgi:hypothetical protein
MGKYSAPHPVTGDLKDIVCRRHGPGWYTVHVGDYLAGLAVAQSFGGWSAVSHADPEMLRGSRSCDGFRRRWDAIVFLLRACGSHRAALMPSGTGSPAVTVLSADAIAAGELVTVCAVAGTDLAYARKADPADGPARQAPGNVAVLGVEHYIAEIARRAGRP